MPNENMAEMPHSLVLDEREHLSVTGVRDVSSFDEASIVADTSRGLLVIHGAGLHIERLSLDMGELVIEGEVSSLEYEEERSAGGGFFRRLFG